MSARRLLAVTAAGLVTGSSARSPRWSPVRARCRRTPQTLTARIVVTSLTPTLVQQDDTVHVTGRITNLGKTAIEQVSVRLRAVGGRLGTRDDVDTWLDGRDPREGVPVNPTAELEAPLAAGRSATFTLDVPAQALGLRGGPFGAYPIAFDARATDTEGVRDQVAFLRSTLQWQPPAREYVRQQIAWLVPFTGLPGPTANVVPTMEQVQAALAPGRRLPRLLDAASSPGVAWAVDPALLATLQQAADGTLPSTSTASPTGRPTTSSPTTARRRPATPRRPPSTTPTTARDPPGTGGRRGLPRADAGGRRRPRGHRAAVRRPGPAGHQQRGRHVAGHRRAGRRSGHDQRAARRRPRGSTSPGRPTATPATG